jgi:hypothetical protein
MNESNVLLCNLIRSGLSARNLCAGPVAIKPASIFIDDHNNVAYLYINNNSDETREIRIASEFSYPGSDKEGNMTNITDDIQSELRYGLRDNLTIFPKQLVLKPGGKKAVRLEVQSLENKPDGTYWTRVIVSSGPGSEAAGTLTEDLTRINYIFRQNLPVFYKKGKVNTGLIAGEVSTCPEDGKLVTVIRLRPTGNSPFNGMVTTRLIDTNGEQVAVQKQSIVAYFNVLRRIEIYIPRKSLDKGRYRLDFTFETSRSDISSEHLVQAAPVRYSAEVDIN